MNEKRKNDDKQSKLYKAPKRGEVSGVCVGLADFLNLDVSVVRLIFVLLVLMGGPGIIAYIVLAVVLPDERDLYPERYMGNTYIHETFDA